MHSITLFVSYLFSKHRIFEGARFLSYTFISLLVVLGITFSVLHFTRSEHVKPLSIGHKPAYTPTFTPWLRVCQLLFLSIGLWFTHMLQLHAMPSFDPFDAVTPLSLLGLIPSAMAAYTVFQVLTVALIARTLLYLYGFVLGTAMTLMPYVVSSSMLEDTNLGFTLVSGAVAWCLNVGLAITMLELLHKLKHQTHWQYAVRFVVMLVLIGMSIFVMQSINLLTIELTISGQNVPFIHAKLWFLVLLVGSLALSFIYLLAFKSQQLQQLSQQVSHSQQQQQQLSAVLNTFVDGMLTLNSAGTILSCNEHMASMVGWSVTELTGQHIQVFFPDLYRMHHDQYLVNYLKVRQSNGMNESRQTVGERKCGSRFPAQLTVIQAYGLESHLFVAYVKDLTDVVSAELKLREKDQQIQAMMENIPGVAFRCHYDANWSMHLISPAVFDLTGWHAHDFIKGLVHFSHLIVDEDISRTYECVETAVKDKQSYQVDYRIRNRAGNERWITEIARPLYNDAGEVIMLDGILLDITESKRQAAEYEGFVNAIHQSTNMAELSIEGYFITANQRFLNQLGYQRWDLIGRHHSVFTVDVEPTTTQPSWESLRQGLGVRGEFMYINKQGQHVQFRAAYFPVLDLNNQFSKVLMFLINLNDPQWGKPQIAP